MMGYWANNIKLKFKIVDKMKEISENKRLVTLGFELIFGDFGYQSTLKKD